MAQNTKSHTKKLVIRAVDAKSSAAESSPAPFYAQLNPNTFKHDHGINYSNQNHGEVMGTLAPINNFSAYQNEKVNFELLFDATGVTESGSAPVAQQIKKLKSVVYQYQGNDHQPSVVQVSWGTFSLVCRLNSLNISYTLFDNEGTPLRATASLAFEQYLNQNEVNKLKNNSSPDLTHRVVFKEGDTLPGLCNRIYHDCRYYPEVARINQLDSVTSITPGTSLYFPPLV